MEPGSTPRIAFLLDNLSAMGEYQINIWRGVLAGARQNGVELTALIGGSLDSHPSNEFEASRNFIYEEFDPRSVDGIVISGGSLGNHTSPERWKAFCSRLRSVPIVSITPAGHGIPHVTIDNEAGLAAILEHLVDDHGRKRVAIITGTMTNPDARARYECWLEVMKSRGLPHDDSLVYNGDWTHESGRAGAADLVSRGRLPDAIVCANDNMAVGALGYLQSQGIKVPQQIILTGFDDTEEAAISMPKLSTVRQPVFELAQKTVELLAESIRSGVPVPEETRVPTTAIRRASCGCGAREIETLGNNIEVGAAITRLFQLDAFRRKLSQGTLDRLAEWTESALVSTAAESAVRFQEFEDILRGNRSEKLLDGLEHVLSEVQKAYYSYAALDESSRTVIQILQGASALVHEARVIALHLRRNEAEVTSNLLVESNRVLAGSFSLDDLEERVSRVFPQIGIRTLLLLITDERGEASVFVNMVDGKGQSERGQPPARGRISSLVDAFQKRSGVKDLMVQALYYRNERLGVVAFEQTVPTAFVYDALTLQLSTNIEGSLLFERIRNAEHRANIQSDQLKQLVIPMLETLQKVAEETTNQDAQLQSLTSVNTTARSLADRARNIFQEMLQEIARITQLLNTINEISETVSVVAINASISAARAGEAGKAFAVIASEIRNLAGSTKQRVAEAEGLVDSVLKISADYTNSMESTMTSFQDLSSRTGLLADSLDQVTKHIDQLARNGQNIFDQLG